MYKDVTVVYAIATAHKGKISAKSEDGNSLTFSILLN
jgi:signal transduction histidine kinase